MRPKATQKPAALTRGAASSRRFVVVTAWLTPALTAIYLFADPSRGEAWMLPTDWFPAMLVTLMAIAGLLLAKYTDTVSATEARAWPASFGLALLFAMDFLPALLLVSACAIASGLAYRRHWSDTLFMWCRDALALLVATIVAHLLVETGDHRGLVDMATTQGMLTGLLCGAVFFTISYLMEGIRRGLEVGRVGEVVLRVATIRAPVGAAQTVMAVMIALLVQVTPWWTSLGLVPVFVLHYALSTSRRHLLASRRDPLTGLMNRSRLEVLLDSACEELSHDQQLALVLLDLDHFKYVNTVLGHPTGDEVLCAVAQRLERAFRDAMAVARLGGDEFAILVAVRDEAEARSIGERVAAVLAEPYRHESNHLVDVNASIGIALAPQHGRTMADLFSHADAAMYASKDAKTGLTLYSTTMASPTVSRLGIVGSLRRAIENDEFYLDFQPKISLKTRRMVGVEALVRWRHPSGQLVPPDEFIPAAERSGIMPELTDLVLRMALKEIWQWRRHGIEVPVAVNVTSTDLLKPGFVDKLTTMLHEFQVPATNLTLEVTERVLTGDLAGARAVMVELNKMGVRLAMDDFGTGWSSLLMLRSLPVTEVKLDRSFVAGIESDLDRAIVSKVTELAHALDLVVVAEGVETSQVMDRLLRLGCDEAQGWYIARPMPGSALLEWASRQGVVVEGNQIASAAVAVLESLANGKRPARQPIEPLPRQHSGTPHSGHLTPEAELTLARARRENATSLAEWKATHQAQ
ncbi:MAG: putative bifunctional diguanylate cyclase/phosphodiesterase [Actinomycetales bacterium]